MPLLPPAAFCCQQPHQGSAILLHAVPLQLSLPRWPSFCTGFHRADSNFFMHPATPVERSPSSIPRNPGCLNKKKMKKGPRGYEPIVSRSPKKKKPDFVAHEFVPPHFICLARPSSVSHSISWKFLVRTNGLLPRVFLTKTSVEEANMLLSC